MGTFFVDVRDLALVGFWLAFVVVTLVLLPTAGDLFDFFKATFRFALGLA